MLLYRGIPKTCYEFTQVATNFSLLIRVHTEVAQSTGRNSTKLANNSLQHYIRTDMSVNADQVHCCIVLTSLTLAARTIPTALHMMAYQQPQEMRQMVTATANIMAPMAKLESLVTRGTVFVTTWGCTSTAFVICGRGKEELIVINCQVSSSV